MREILPWLVQSGGLGVAAWAMITLHRSAIRSEARRADAWERIAMMRERQLAVLTGAELPRQPEPSGRDGPSP